MNETTTDPIAHLDWETTIPCTRTGCENPSAHLVLVNPGPEGCLHLDWYPACPQHLTALAAGLARCQDCKETLILQASRDL